MRHRKRRFKNSRTSAHRRAMLANLACSVLSSGRVETTVPRAKEVRRLVEKMITLGKDGSLAARRRAVTTLGQKPVVRHLFDQLSDNFEARQGGYTRIVKTGVRRGDAAEMCLIELVEKSSDQSATDSEREAKQPAAKPEPVAVSSTEKEDSAADAQEDSTAAEKQADAPTS